MGHGETDYSLKRSSMVKINMLSRNFAHAHSSTWWKKPKNIIWEFNSSLNPISVYIDNDAMKGVNDNISKYKFLWLLESKRFDGGAMSMVKNNLNAIVSSYDEIWTHNDELLSIDSKFKWCPAYGSYIEDCKIHDKTKTVSMITSNKRWTKQHEIRHNFALKYLDKMDVFGRGIKEIQNKEEGLKDYMFSFAFENDTYDTYFTEKILDCFATGTIPIYMGTKKVVNHFNPDGVMWADGSDYDFSQLTSELYYSKMDAIKDNFEKVQNYLILDDWIFENYLINYV